jgi:hypothetical protein
VPHQSPEHGGGGHAGKVGGHDQAAGPGGLRLLARLRQPAQLHEPPGVGGAVRRRALALDGQRPAGTTVDWEAEIVEDIPSQRIAWRSVEGSKVGNSGSVTFSPAPGDRGTEVRVELAYDPPGGTLGKVVAKLLGEEPQQQVSDDLRRLKQVLETGQVVLSEGSPEGTRFLRLLSQRPAQPVA